MISLSIIRLEPTYWYAWFVGLSEGLSKWMLRYTNCWRSNGGRRCAQRDYNGLSFDGDTHTEFWSRMIIADPYRIPISVTQISVQLCKRALRPEIQTKQGSIQWDLILQQTLDRRAVVIKIQESCQNGVIARPSIEWFAHQVKKQNVHGSGSLCSFLFHMSFERPLVQSELS